MVCLELISTEGGMCEERKKMRRLTAEYQFDTRKFNTLNFTGASSLPAGFSVSGFTDIESTKNWDDRKYDLATHFLEIDLKTPMWMGVGLVGELNSASGPDNDIGRLGLYYLPKWQILRYLDLSLFFFF